MADTAELKHMVMSFRVSELQVLLGFAGKNKSGRKQELIERALNLVSHGCSMPIQIKIKELYKRRFPPKHQLPVSSVHSTNSTSQDHSTSNHSNSLNPGYRSSCYSGTLPSSTRYRQPPSAGTRGHGSSSSSNNLDYKTSSHPSSLPPPPSSTSSSSSSRSQVPVHPDVRFKRLSFFQQHGELLKPSSLVPRSQSRFQECFFIFHLTPQQAQDIAMSRDTLPEGRVDYTRQIQLRFCLLETSCEQEDNFPPSICVRVNGKMAALPNPIPTNKPGVEPKRPSRPVNITPICRISPTVPNHINISWASELGRSYCVSVHLVERLNSDILLQRLKNNGVKHPDHTRALIKEKLAQDPDSEISTTSLRVSLNCPLGKMRMAIPSRSTACNHLQCFDAPTFLQMNEKKPTWLCPVCDRSAEYQSLLIDGLFTEMLREASDAEDIRFTEDGNWHPIKAKEEEIIPDSPIQVQTIGGDDDSPKKQQDEFVIDLTETDDEEDDDDDDDDDCTRAVSLNSSCSNLSSHSSGSEASTPSTVISSAPAIHSSGAGISRSNSSTGRYSKELEKHMALDLSMMSKNKPDSCGFSADPYHFGPIPHSPTYHSSYSAHRVQAQSDIDCGNISSDLSMFSIDRNLTPSPTRKNTEMEDATRSHRHFFDFAKPSEISDGIKERPQTRNFVNPSSRDNGGSDPINLDTP